MKRKFVTILLIGVMLCMSLFCNVTFAAQSTGTGTVTDYKGTVFNWDYNAVSKILTVTPTTSTVISGKLNWTSGWEEVETVIFNGITEITGSNSSNSDNDEVIPLGTSGNFSKVKSIYFNDLISTSKTSNGSSPHFYFNSDTDINVYFSDSLTSLNTSDFLSYWSGTGKVIVHLPNNLTSINTSALFANGNQYRMITVVCETGSDAEAYAKTKTGINIIAYEQQVVCPISLANSSQWSIITPEDIEFSYDLEKGWTIDTYIYVSGTVVSYNNIEIATPTEYMMTSSDNKSVIFAETTTTLANKTINSGFLKMIVTSNNLLNDKETISGIDENVYKIPISCSLPSEEGLLRKNYTGNLNFYVSEKYAN